MISISRPPAATNLHARAAAARCRPTLLLSILCIAGLAAVFGGCVLSVAPVVPEAAAIFDERLLGTWEIEDGSQRAVISRLEDTSYAIEYTTDGEVSAFEARLGRLGDRLILDLWPAPAEGALPQTYGELLVEGHLALFLELEHDEMRIELLDADSLLAAIEGGDIHLPHGISNERLVLYGGSNDVRTAISSYLNAGGALVEDELWTRAEGE